MAPVDKLVMAPEVCGGMAQEIELVRADALKQGDTILIRDGETCTFQRSVAGDEGLLLRLYRQDGAQWALVQRDAVVAKVVS